MKETLFHWSESLFDFLTIPWWRRWPANLSSDSRKSSFCTTDMVCVSFYEGLAAEWEDSTHFSFPHSCCCLLSDLAVTLCRVCFLWGFGAPVAVLVGGCWRLTKVDCGSWGRPRQIGLVFGLKRFVSERWYGISSKSFKICLQSKQPARLWVR